MAWGWRPVMHSIHLFLLMGTISMATCWWLGLRETVYASPPSPILWFICVFYVLFAIIIVPATIDTWQLLRIPKLATSVIARAILLFAVSISLATLIAAAALEPPTVSATAKLALFAILNFFPSVIMISNFPLVALVDINHRRIPNEDLVDYCARKLSIGALLLAIYITVRGVRLAAASHAVVATEPVAADAFDFEVIGCAVLAFCSVLFSIFVAGHLPASAELTEGDGINI